MQLVSVAPRERCRRVFVSLAALVVLRPHRLPIRRVLHPCLVAAALPVNFVAFAGLAGGGASSGATEAFLTADTFAWIWVVATAVVAIFTRGRFDPEPLADASDSGDGGLRLFVPPPPASPRPDPSSKNARRPDELGAASRLEFPNPDLAGYVPGLPVATRPYGDMLLVQPPTDVVAESEPWHRRTVPDELRRRHDRTSHSRSSSSSSSSDDDRDDRPPREEAAATRSLFPARREPAWFRDANGNYKGPRKRPVPLGPDVGYAGIASALWTSTTAVLLPAPARRRPPAAYDDPDL